MRLAIYGNVNKETKKEILYFLEVLQEIISKAELFIYHEIYEEIKEERKINNLGGIFCSHKNFNKECDLIFSLGGDGTFLKCVSIVRDSGVPMIGINLGRLGFLANIALSEIHRAIEDIVAGQYEYEYRTLLELNSSKIFPAFNFGLNEITIHKKDTSSMITIHVYLNNQLLNRYWADGLIISTPTGSTAYSLSVGGPLVMPETDVFVLSPIAPHNLNVRPMIIADNMEITIEVSSRSEEFLASIDYHSEIFNKNCKLKIKKADFKVKMLKLQRHNYCSTLRNKLMWGKDKRN